MSERMRIDKMLSHTGFGTRKEVKELIKSGVVSVNGKVVKKPKEQVDPEGDEIVVGLESIEYQKYYYFMLNKPQDVISATQDYMHHTVIDLLEPSDAISEPHPVGRLDIDTEGLLLLTNDGAMSHRLTSPNREVPKIYLAEVDGVMTEADIEAFKAGVTLDDGYEALPGELEIIEVDEDNQTSVVEITVIEGKYHQVKRMVKSVGKKVTYLKRLSMGPIKLDNTLALGEYRELTEAEIELLEEYTGVR